MITIRSISISLLPLLPCLLSAQSTVTLTTSANPAQLGAPITLNATVSPTTATGRVTLYDGTTVLGIKPLTGGAAAFVTRSLPFGPHKLRAYYAGDGANPAATSNVVNETVNAQRGGGLTAAGSTTGQLLAIGDFNGDGKADTLSLGNNGLLVALGDGTGNFQAPLSQTLPNCQSSVLGDFNGDGTTDIACIAGGIQTSTVNILMGKGDGTFQVPLTFPIAVFSQLLAVGDLNGDGKLDLVANVATSGTSSGLQVLLGNGDGTFHPAPLTPGTPSPSSFFVAVADFNSDSKADVVIFSGFSVEVLLGRGDGSFLGPIATPLTKLTYSLAAGDLNGDGKVDVVTNNGDVLLGNGDGTFQPPVSYSSHPPPGLLLSGETTVAIGDFNGDGKPDFVLAPSDTPATPAAYLSIALGNGDGTFQPPVIIALASNPGGLFVGEFNGDGITDLAATNFSTATFYLGSSKSITPTVGATQTTTITAAFPTPLQVTLRDGATPLSGVTVTFTVPSGQSFIPSATLSSGTAVTDANGVASVTATANANQGTYVVSATAQGVTTAFLLTNAAAVANMIHASPTTPQSALIGTRFASPLTVTVTDAAGVPVPNLGITFTAPFNGAGALLYPGTALQTAAYSLTNTTGVVTDANGQASVTAFANYTPGSYTVTAVTAFSATSISTTFSLTNVQPAAIPVTLTVTPNPSNLGSPVTLTATVSNPGAQARVTFYDNAKPLATQPVTSGATSFSTTLLSAGVHKLTAYYRDEANAIAGTSNAVTQTVKAAAVASFVPAPPSATPVPDLPVTETAVVAGDFNHDGKADFAFNRAVSGNSTVVTVLLGNGDGTFQPPVDYPIGAPSAAFLVAADFDGDGNTDLVAAASNVTAFQGTNVSILLGRANGTFRPATNVAEGFLLIGSMSVADFNSDGKPDLLLGITGSSGGLDVPITSYFGLIEVLIGNGDGTFGQRFIYPNLAGVTRGTPTPVNTLSVVDDFNGDGKPDVVATSGLETPAIFLGTGDGKAQNPVTLNVPLATVITFLTGDFNGDGKADLAVGGLASGSNAPATTILLGNGDGTFQAPATYSFGITRASGDFNGDGATDFIVADVSRSAIGTLVNKGDGTFQQGPAFAAGNPLAIADFNRDGSPDIVSSNTGSGGHGVLLGLAISTNPPASISATAGTPQSALISSAFGLPLQVTVKDASGAPVSGATVTFTSPLTGPSASLSNANALTDNTGVASVSATANSLPGSYLVTAAVSGLSTTFSLTNVVPGGNNIAIGKTATQSSNLTQNPVVRASLAIDGKTDGNFYDGSVTHTGPDANAWWQVDLGSSLPIQYVTIWNRTDCCSDRLSDYWVFASNSPFAPTDTPASLQIRDGVFARHQTLAPNPSATVFIGASYRYVRIQLNGTNNLSLAEVQVISPTAPDITNLALNKPVAQSSTYAAAVATRAVDGSTDGNYFLGSVTHTLADANAWWQVDLGSNSAINSIVISNRTDCCGDRLNDYWVFVSTAPFAATDTPATLQNRADVVFVSHQTSAPNPSTSLPVSAIGRYVRVQLSGTNNLSLAEVQVLGTGTSLTNLALRRPATQSSTLSGYPSDSAGAAVDGNSDGNFFDGSVTHTNADPNAWWQVDLGASATISSIQIANRTDCCSDRLSDYWVFVSDTPFLDTDTPATLMNRAGTFHSHQTTSSVSTQIVVETSGRYVRVQLSGTGNLSLAEVMVLGTGGVAAPTNLALASLATQSSTLPGSGSANSAALAVDGNTDGGYYDGSVTHTNTDVNAWWQTDLRTSVSISSIVIWNRTDCCSERLNDYWVFVSDTPFLATDTPATLMNRAGTIARHQTSAPNPSTTINVTGTGRYVRVQLSGTNNLSLAEVQVYGQ